MKNVIFGNNTEAKILSYLLNYPMIVHDDFGKSTFSNNENHAIIARNMVYIRFNDITNKFLQLIGFDSFPKTLKLTFSIDGTKQFPLEEMKHELKSLLLKKKLSTQSESIYTDEQLNNTIFGKEKDNSISLISSIDINLMLHKLTELTKRNIIDLNHLGKIEYITENQIVFKKNGIVFDFNYAITTIKANTLEKLLHNKIKTGLEYKYIKTTLKLFRRKKPTNKTITDTNIYFPTSNQKYSRINFFNDANECIVDYSGAVMDKQLNSDWKFISEVILPIGKIRTIRNLYITDTIEPCGRFAQWDADVTLDDIMLRGFMHNTLQYLWAKQKQMHQLRMDASTYDATIIEKQKFTQEYILHIINQSSKLLDEINWKSNMPRKDLFLQQITEHWVDIFKYWLSIGITWGISPKDFILMEKIKHNKGIAKIKNR